MVISTESSLTNSSVDHFHRPLLLQAIASINLVGQLLPSTTSIDCIHRLHSSTVFASILDCFYWLLLASVSVNSVNCLHWSLPSIASVDLFHRPLPLTASIVHFHWPCPSTNSFLPTGVHNEDKNSHENYGHLTFLLRRFMLCIVPYTQHCHCQMPI